MSKLKKTIMVVNFVLTLLLVVPVVASTYATFIFGSFLTFPQMRAAIMLLVMAAVLNVLVWGVLLEKEFRNFLKGEQ